MKRIARLLNAFAIMFACSTVAAQDSRNLTFDGSSTPVIGTQTLTGGAGGSIDVNGLSIVGALPKFNDPDFTVSEAVAFFTLQLDVTSYLRNNGLLAIPGDPNAGPASIGGFLYTNTISVSSSVAATVESGSTDNDVQNDLCQGAGIFQGNFGLCVTDFDVAAGFFNFTTSAQIASLSGPGTFDLTGLAELLFNFTNNSLIDGKIDYTLSFTDLKVQYKAYCTANISDFEACESYQDAGNPNGNGTVPEPSALVLLGVGLASLVAGRRRTRGMW